MISIRLKKVALRDNLHYSIVVASHTKAPSSGKFIEKIGFYKPLTDKWSNKYVYVDFDRLSFWLNRGAKLNNSVFSLIEPIIVYSFASKN